MVNILSQRFGWVMKAEVWSRFWSWILTNLWHDLKAVILVKARNSWVRCACGNVLHIQHLSPWQRGHGYSRPSQRLVKVLWRTAGREFVLQRKHFADWTCKLFFRGNSQRVGIEQLSAFMFCCYCEGGCSVQPNKYKTGLTRELFVTKRDGHFDWYI